MQVPDPAFSSLPCTEQKLAQAGAAVAKQALNWTAPASSPLQTCPPRREAILVKVLSAVAVRARRKWGDDLGLPALQGVSLCT